MKRGLSCGIWWRVFSEIIARGKMCLHGAGGGKTASVILAVQHAVQKMNAVEVRGSGYTVSFGSPLLQFRIYDQPRGGMIGSGGGLLGKLLHAYELFGNDLQYAQRSGSWIWRHWRCVHHAQEPPYLYGNALFFVHNRQMSPAPYGQSVSHHGFANSGTAENRLVVCLADS